MSGFLRGVLIGVGIGFLVAPMKGEELRHILGERLQELQGLLPENLQLEQYALQFTNTLEQSRKSLSELTQVAINKVVKENGSTWNDLAQLAMSKLQENGISLGDLVRLAISATKLIG